MKRVCIIRQNYFPEEAHVRKNVDALTAAGYAVDVICLRDRGESAREAYAEGTVHRLPLTRRRGGALRYAFEYLAFLTMASLLISWLALRRRYREGIPERPAAENEADAKVLYQFLRELGGKKLVGPATELAPGTFWHGSKS